jgi:hypothetical protein
LVGSQGEWRNIDFELVTIKQGMGSWHRRCKGLLLLLKICYQVGRLWWTGYLKG